MAARKIKRPKPTEEWGKFMTRLLRAYGKRAAEEDPWVVVDMLRNRDQLNAQITQAVAGLVHRGYSWSVIAAELGMSKQAAYKRWAHLVAPLVAEMETDRLAGQIAALAVAVDPDGALAWAESTPVLAGV